MEDTSQGCNGERWTDQDGWDGAARRLRGGAIKIKGWNWADPEPSPGNSISERGRSKLRGPAAAEGLCVSRVREVKTQREPGRPLASHGPGWVPPCDKAERESLGTGSRTLLCLPERASFQGLVHTSLWGSFIHCSPVAGATENKAELQDCRGGAALLSSNPSQHHTPQDVVGCGDHISKLCGIDTS